MSPENEKLLLTGLESIAKRPVHSNDNLLSIVDSISLVEIINLVDQVARKSRKKIDLENLVSGETLTVRSILEALA